MQGSSMSSSLSSLRPQEPVVPMSSLSTGWGSLEDSISQALNLTPRVVKVEPAKAGEYPLGKGKQTSISNFKEPISVQINKLNDVLQNFATPAQSIETKTEQAPEVARDNGKASVSVQDRAEAVLDKASAVSTSVKKESLDIFGALKSLVVDELAFKHLTPEQKKKEDERKAKLQKENANKKSFYDALSSARMALENFMMKMLMEMQDRLGLGGKSVVEKNALLGMKARNLSYTGINTPYHIKAMHDALIEQEAEQKRQQAKASAPAGGQKKINYFMDKNSSISRQGQSVYSAAG